MLNEEINQNNKNKTMSTLILVMMILVFVIILGIILGIYKIQEGKFKVYIDGNVTKLEQRNSSL